jgi:hypothetical protein
MDTTSILQKLVLISLVAVVVSASAFTIVLVCTSKERPVGGTFESEDLPFKMPFKKLNLESSQDNEDKSEISSQHFAMPYLWNIIMASLVVMVITVIGLLWDGQRKGKINILQGLDLDQEELDSEE